MPVIWYGVFQNPENLCVPQVLPLVGIFERCMKNSQTRSNPPDTPEGFVWDEKMSGIRTKDVDILLSSCYSL